MTSGSKQKSYWLRHSIKYILSFALSGVFLYIAFYKVNFNKVVEIVSHASLLWIFVSIIVLMFAHYLRAIRWKIILKSVKHNPSVLNLIGALMVGYGVNCVVPRLGEVTRAVLIGRWEKLSRSSMFGTIVLERIIDVIFLGLSVVVSVLIWSTSLYKSFPWLKTTLYLTLLIMVTFFLFLFYLVKYKEKFYGAIIKMIGIFSKRIANKAAYVFDMLLQGFTSLKGTKNYFFVIILSSLIMMLYALNSYIGFLMIGMENIKPVTYGMGWVLMSISAIGVVIPTPGGTGSYHALAKAALVLLFGFGESIGFAYAFLTHIVTYILYILTAIFFFFILNKQHDNIIEIVETGVEEL